MTPRSQRFYLFALTFLFAVQGCCYHTAGKAVRLSENVRSIYVPMFTNDSQAFSIEQVLTASVVQELRSRSNLHVMVTDGDSADATLKGAVTSVTTSPLTYNSQTGKVATSQLQIGMKVSLVDKAGKVLWSDPGYYYREQYELSQDAASFFEEESPAAQRIAHSFAKTLVSSIMEAY